MLARIITVLAILGQIQHAYACEKVELRCTMPAQTRMIGEDTQVYKDCWQYKYRLNCDKESKNNCKNISAENCSLVEEKCLKMDPQFNVCTNYERSYACEKAVEYEEEKLELLKDSETDDGKGLLCSNMCLDGSCVEKASTEKNDEMVNVVSLLNGLKSAKDNLSGDVLVNIFSGKSEHCDKKLLNYTNCCRLGGWGKAFGAKCSSEAQNLAKKRKEKKCVEVGTYCKSKLPFGVCGIKRTAFCCYDSVLVRILNQEAKRQLGRNNGSSENLQCGGLNLEDLERVDFSNVDFSEYFEKELLPQLKIPTVQDGDFERSHQDIEKFSKNLSDEKKGFSEKMLKEGGM